MSSAWRLFCNAVAVFTHVFSVVGAIRLYSAWGLEVIGSLAFSQGFLMQVYVGLAASAALVLGVLNFSLFNYAISAINNEREEKKQTVVDVLENLRSDIAKHNHSTRYGHRPDTSLTSRISIAVDKIKKYGIHPPEDLDMGQLHEHCGLLVPFVDQYGAKRARQEMLVWWRKARKEQ